MASFYLLLLCMCVFSIRLCHARTFSFQMHHRFSEPLRKWSLDWPIKGTFDYYSALADRDRILHRRHLRRRLSQITFSQGNSTLRMSSMGFLHYATVSLGTPSKKFLVALDTGSDLFWVPCDCARYSLTAASTYGADYELSIYNPKGSSTSKKVTCNNHLCAHRNRCLGTFSNCPYMVSYISADTSTSGILVEDVLHLITEDRHLEVVDALITFGCGQVQTGSFLDFAAPNGLFGLGMDKISVPSILSRVGLTADSFSMCFGRDGYGKISFGDKGSFDQEETPFNYNKLHPTYSIGITQIRVGTSLIDTQFDALFDSGTSFTYLVGPSYTQLTQSFNLQARDSRRPPDPRIPFEYCYDMSSDANSSMIPSMSLTMRGGSHFHVYDPIIIISTRADFVYCLAVVKSTEMNIIGQNFMTGYRIVFDREKLVLGWKNFDCYDVEDSDTVPVNLQNSSSFPPPASVRSDSYTPEAKKDARNHSQISLEPPLPPSPSHATSSSNSINWNLKSSCFTIVISSIIFRKKALI
ncbi:hypothetical protein GIB67_040809 [Kingdonia uniflora]|uniref:Peptidase A1 domain-containing protein n=1 Tax=Kingdonia uniflora TaxID=39325 RepID=A0A7J7P4D6_9MAGN|nr:hypothetical protein GIB67_040809 [Kingdonia uniflora]